MFEDMLGIIVPSNNPKVLRRYFLSSLEYISEIAEFSTILYNLQGYWSAEDLECLATSTKSAGFNFKISRNDYEISAVGEIPMCQIRQDAAKLLPSARYYLLLDDDISFLPSKGIRRSSGFYYLVSLHYLITHNKCGILFLKNNRSKDKLPRDHIGPSQWRVSCITGLGIFVNSMEYLLYPDDSLSIVGSDEEKILAQLRLASGFYPARLDYVNARHWENNSRSITDSSAAAVSGEVLYRWNKYDILEKNANRYLRIRYPKFTNNGSRPTELLSYDDYLCAGGYDYLAKTEHDLYKELYKDYSSIEITDIKEDIYRGLSQDTRFSDAY